MPLDLDTWLVTLVTLVAALVAILADRYLQIREGRRRAAAEVLGAKHELVGSIQSFPYQQPFKLRMQHVQEMKRLARSLFGILETLEVEMPVRHLRHVASIREEVEALNRLVQDKKLVIQDRPGHTGVSNPAGMRDDRFRSSSDLSQSISKQVKRLVHTPWRRLFDD